MNQLFIKQELDSTITKEQLLEDMDCLFENLREAYGMYDYFGEDAFSKARVNIGRRIREDYEFEKSIKHIKEELSFIKDGHFYIGKPIKSTGSYNYAIKYTSWEGVPVIDCKKCYYDNEIEKEQLEEFAKKGAAYKSLEPLILDLRDNEGGSTVYIYDFLCALLEQEIGYTLKYIGKRSKLFSEYLMEKGIAYEPNEEEVLEETYPLVKNKKPIYVLFNEKTASAAEEGIAFLKNIENVTLVGTHTAGCVSCGNCMKIYLPNSHLEVYFGTGLMLYDGYRSIDAEGGFKGDISCEAFFDMLKNI